jgi:transposase
LGSHIHERLKILLNANEQSNNSLICRNLCRTRETIRKWRKRAITFFTQKWSDDWSLKEIVRFLLSIVSDAPRSGRSLIYDANTCCKIMALAVRKPEEFGRVSSHWSLTELTEEVNKQGFAQGISRSSVARILKEADIRPHKMRYWLNPKIEDQDLFEEEINQVCKVYLLYSKEPDTTVYSVDEKTGIQALEFIHPSKPVKAGSPEKIEFEYKRHGTLCLIPSFNVSTGKIDEFKIGKTRNEQDFAEHIRSSIQKSPTSRIIFVADQLNTHKSETLVRLIVKECEMKLSEEELGCKGKSGILKSQKTRMKFLSKSEHRIRFCYTPKHCSWLNQVEIWFGVLSRKLLKRSSFSTLKILESKIAEFIDYFNQYLAKPYRWTYEGKALKK